jgi:hypothetical protein
MSQEASTNQTTLDAPENSTDSSWWSQESEAESLTEAGALPVESYADSLMDDLFEEVDQILERGVTVPAEPAKPEFVSLQPLSIPRLIMPSMLMPRSSELTVAPTDTELAELVEAATSTAPPQGTGSSVDRLLLFAAFASIVATGLLWWFVFREKTAQVVTTPDATAQSAAQLKAQEDTQFLHYVQRSLEAIDRRTETSRVASAPQGTAPGGNLPSVSVPGSSTPAASNPPTVLERVYIPVYQPPQTLYPAPNPALINPTAINPTAMNPAPVAPAPAIPAPAAAPANGTTPNIAAAPVMAHVLVGIMQLGDRSAALFEINSVAQRVYIGESIGTSGWTLVSVSNQEAIVRRNGEVRSIYVGQQF